MQAQAQPGLAAIISHSDQLIGHPSGAFQVPFRNSRSIPRADSAPPTARRNASAGLAAGVHARRQTSSPPRSKGRSIVREGRRSGRAGKCSDSKRRSASERQLRVCRSSEGKHYQRQASIECPIHSMGRTRFTHPSSRPFAHFKVAAFAVRSRAACMALLLGTARAQHMRAGHADGTVRERATNLPCAGPRRQGPAAANASNGTQVSQSKRSGVRRPRVFASGHPAGAAARERRPQSRDGQCRATVPPSERRDALAAWTGGSGMTGMPLRQPLRAAGRAGFGSDWRQRACRARKRGGGKQDGAQPQAEKQSVS